MTSKATEATKEITFKADLRESADTIVTVMHGDKETGVITVDASVIEKLMPEGQTLESHLAHQRTFDLISNAFALAGVEKSNELMAANKALESTSYKVPTFGKNYLEGSFKRHGVSRAPGSAEVTNYVGAVGVAKHEVISTRTQSESKAIKDHFKAIALEADL